MEVSRSNWRKNSFAVNLEGPAEADSFSHALGFLRGAWLRYRASQGESTRVNMRHHKVIKVAGQLQQMALPPEGCDIQIQQQEQARKEQGITPEIVQDWGEMATTMRMAVRETIHQELLIAQREEQFHQALSGE